MTTITPGTYKKAVPNLIFSGLNFSGAVKCIELVDCNGLKSDKCVALNFSKRFVDLRNSHRAEISNFIADAQFNASMDFCIGISIGESQDPTKACDDVYIHDGTIRNIKYGGTATYLNGDGICIERGCQNIRIERVFIKNVPDGGVDSKSSFTMKDSMIQYAKHGIRIWDGVADLENIVIKDCGDDIWLASETAKLRLKNVTCPTRKLKIVSGAGLVPVLDNDPRIEWVPADPIVQINNLRDELNQKSMRCA